MTNENRSLTGLEVAIIGMAGRFPGAKSCDELWKNLINGVESIAFFSDRELEESGVDSDLRENPNYVKACGILEGIEYFDASFFDYKPIEAEILNPQVRIFLECSWEALEDAGYDPGTYNSLIGLYAGASSSFNWELLSILSGKDRQVGGFTAANLTNKDHLCTGISYRLDLKGPSCAVQTACSTSLVAIHWACRAVLSGECHIALAGGVIAAGIQKRGYLYTEGMILSSDGHCRAFDAKANGTMGGNGAAVVVLKRLKKAAAEGDHIYALIKGSAINNDGKRKVGFTAPSVEGQAHVIQTAMAMAQFEPESISYIETHGTATHLGDPVEIEALTLAFKSSAAVPGNNGHYCAIGSIKTNLGHLDCAAGAAGIIKTVLALRNRLIPPTIHFETPNPGIDFENSPFYVNTKLIQWKNETYPLRAGVSAFGIGGTNAHVVLEEWPEDRPQTTGESEYQLIILSARTESALDQMTQNLAGHLKKNPGINLADAAYTLQAGRKPFRFRRMTMGKTIEEVVEELTSPHPVNLRTAYVKEKKNRVVFMFPGQGSQYVNMGLELYYTQPVFREEMDRCFEILKGLTDYNVKEMLYPGDSVNKVNEVSNQSSPDFNRSDGSYMSHITHKSSIHRTEITQPVLFIFEYALARLLMTWGIKPRAMIGHSIGEYAAACLAGMVSLEDSLRIVNLRGRLMQQMPTGSMLSIQLPEKELKPLLSSYKELDLAAVNNDSRCVVSGPDEAVEHFRKFLAENGHEARKLHTSHAFHSKMMDPLLAEFKMMVSKIRMDRAKIPYISNVTGNWIGVGDAIDSAYWAAHVRQTVRFARGLDNLLKKGNCILVEVGPGTTLNSFAMQHKTGNNKALNRLAFNLVRHPHENIRDDRYLLDKIGKLWLQGVKIDWNQLIQKEKKHRISLPTYPFEKQRYWIDGDPFKIAMEMFTKNNTLKRKENLSDWFYIPSWKKTVPPFLVDRRKMLKDRRNWLIFLDDMEIGREMAKILRETGHERIVVTKADGFLRTGDGEYTLNVFQSADYDALIRDLVKRGRKPGIIVHLWGVTGNGDNRSGIESFHRYQHTGYYSLIFLTRALARHGLVHAGIERQGRSGGEIRLAVITDKVQAVTEEENICPGKTTLLGPCKTIPQEYRDITCQSIDVSLPGADPKKKTELVHYLIAEILAGRPDQVMAYRRNTRWVQCFEPIRLERSSGIPLALKKRGVYLITGGLGRDSLIRAKYLAETVKARLVLVGRSRMPNCREWDQWINTHPADDPVSEKIKKIRQIEEAGGEVLVISADVADEHDMKSVITQIDKQFGALNGVIHAAGITTIESSILISKLHRRQSDWHFRPKVYGLYTLEKVLKGRQVDFCLLTSSLASFSAGGGLTAYTAANIFMDAFAYTRHQRNSLNWMSLNWIGLSPEETNDAFHRMLNLELVPQLVVCHYELNRRLEQGNKRVVREKEDRTQHTPSSAIYRRTDNMGPYVPPTNKTEQTLAAIWEKFFGITPVGIQDNFFELGGDSLSAITVMARIHMELHAELSLAEFFQEPTIKELGEYIDQYTLRRVFSSIEPTEKKEYYPSSSAQKRLYFLQQLSSDSAAYNIRQTVPLHEGVDLKKIEEILKKIISRYESLRTSFEMIKGESMQRIHKEMEFTVREYENLGLDTIKPEPFDLGRAPLLRAAVIKPSPTGRILVIEMHHIITDGISQNIFGKEFMELYSGEELPPLRLQYKDYSDWQNSKKQRQLIKEQERYWLEIFSDEFPVLNLPTDYPRPAIQSFEGNSISFEIGIQEGGGLKKIAQEEGASLFMVILAIFNILLSKLSGQEDIVIGTPVAGRRHSDLEKIIGMFVNTLSLRNYPCGDRTFREFRGNVKERVLKAFENQEYPFEELVDKLSVKRDMGRNPLFDIMFSLQNMNTVSASQDEDTGIESTRLLQHDSPNEYENGIQTAQFDLTLTAVERDRGLLFSIEYCTKLFKKETIERFINYFRKIVFTAVNDQGIRINEIEIISEEEKNRILYKFNDTDADYPKDKMIHRLFEEQVARTPDHVALIGENPKNKASFGQVQLSYGLLNEESNRLAYTLLEKGVRPDTIVGIMIERSVKMLIGIMGILKAGGAYLPIDMEYPGERIDCMLKDSSAKMLVTTNDKEGEKVGRWEGEKVFLEEILKSLNSSTYPLTFLPSDLQISLNLAIGYRQPATSLAYIIYTSGSTGKPKGVLTEHRNVNAYLNAFYHEFVVNESDTALQQSSISFDAFVEEVYPILLRGGKIAITPKEIILDTNVLSKFLLKYDITFISVSPLLLNEIARMPHPGSIRIFISGGDVLKKEYISPIAGKGILYNTYGPTETTVCATYYRYTHCDYSNVPIGNPISNYNVYILSRSGGLGPIDIPGELCIAGDGVARGYLNRPELTAEKFIRDVNGHSSFVIGKKSLVNSHWSLVNNKLPEITNDRSCSHHSPLTIHHSPLYRTGDLARWLSDGNIEFLGRIDHQVKIRGYRVELGEIENQLLTHHEIKETSVQLGENEKGDKYICAYIVSDHSIRVSELREYLLKRLPEYMAPSYFIFLDRIPLTPNGKIDRKALPGPEAGMASEGFLPPRDETEEKLTVIWADVLAIEKEKIGIGHNFFELGGNSLSMMTMVSKIYNEFGCEVPITQIYNKPLISEISKIMITKNFEEAAVVLLNKVTPKKIFCFPAQIGYGFLFHRLARILNDYYSFYAFNFIEDIEPAARLKKYVDIITDLQPLGPYKLFSYSAGGKLTFQVAKALETRGCVVSDIIFCDCFFVEHTIHYNEDQWREVHRRIDELLNRLGASFLRAKVIEKTEKYAAYDESITHLEKINATVHLILSEDNYDNKRQHSWRKLTSKKVMIYKGRGGHLSMLDDGGPFEMIRNILDKTESGTQTFFKLKHTLGKTGEGPGEFKYL